jgi:glycosyltransferase involved in cell wall biosynthesis
MAKLQVYHFHNGGGGGVLSVIRNLLMFSNNQSIENHIIYAVNKKEMPSYKIEPINGAISQILFYYSSNNNFYNTCNGLSKLLPNDNAIIVAHDWLELGVASNLGLQNPVVFFLHGDYDYYYELARKNENIINTFICVSKSIQQKLISILPGREKDIKYIRFPVPNSNYSFPKNSTNNIIFLGRLTKEKGYNKVAEIANCLFNNNMNLNWHIVGSGEVINTENLNENIQKKFYGNLANLEVQALLEKMNFILLPSLAEGMPVSIIEAMKAGVVPLVNDIEGGIQELIIDDETGFKIKNNIVNDYVTKIILLLKNSLLTEKISKNAKYIADQLFNADKNTVSIENELFNVKNTKIKQPQKVYGSRLDHPFIPNIFTKLLRNIK